MLLSKSFGIDGIVAASADRFLPRALIELRKVHSKGKLKGLQSRKRKARGQLNTQKNQSDDKSIAKKLTSELRKDLDV